MADGAQRRGTAVVARQPGGVADARSLHEHRPVLHGVAQELERLARQPRRPGAGVAGQVAVGVTCEADGDAFADELPGRHHLGGPTGAQEVFRLDAARVGREHGRATGLLGTHQEDLARMGVRRPRLVVEVVAVVPDRHQSEVPDRGERGCASADHHPDRASRDRQERPVALGRPGIGGEHDVPALAEPGRREQRRGGRGRGGRARRRALRDRQKRWPRRPRRGGWPSRPRAAPSRPLEAHHCPAPRGAPRRPGSAWRRPCRASPRSAGRDRRAASRPSRAAVARPVAGRRSGCRRTSRPRLLSGPRRRVSAPARRRPHDAAAATDRCARWWQRARSRIRRRPGPRTAP